VPDSMRLQGFVFFGHSRASPEKSPVSPIKFGENRNGFPHGQGIDSNQFIIDALREWALFGRWSPGIADFVMTAVGENCYKCLFLLARPEGFEPPTLRSEVC
jgi:hypothetical protein